MQACVVLLTLTPYIGDEDSAFSDVIYTVDSNKKTFCESDLYYNGSEY